MPRSITQESGQKAVCNPEICLEKNEVQTKFLRVARLSSACLLVGRLDRPPGLAPQPLRQTPFLVRQVEVRLV